MTALRGRRGGAARRRGRAVPLSVLLSVLLTSAAALTGCASLPTAAPPPAQDHAVVTVAQAQRIASATDDVLARVVGPGAVWDADLADTRLTGPAQQWVAFSVAVGDPAPVGVLSAGHDSVIAPRATSWPRAFAVVGGTPQLLHVYVSESARTPYRLWAAMPVLEPVALPVFGPADTGVTSPLDPAVPVESAPTGAATTAAPTGFDGERPMAEVVRDLPARYLDVLAAGDSSVHAPEFEADGVAASLRERIEAERDRVADVATTDAVHQVLASPDHGIVLSALASNGDALVVVAFNTTVTSTATSGAGITVAEHLVAAAGSSEVGGSLTTQSVAALAFVVPARTGNIRVAAAAEAVTGVTSTQG